MLDESIDVVVQTLRVAGRVDEIADAVDDDPPNLCSFDPLKQADDDPVDLKLDGRRVHHLETAPLCVRGVDTQAAQTRASWTGFSWKLA